MNFLAHVFLSGDDPDLLTGNFIADFVKGKKKDDYPSRIRMGIELHRAIDNFTDHHDIPRQSRHRLVPGQGKYAGVVVDLLYDHFLAFHFDDYSKKSLDLFSSETYRILNERWQILPDGIKAFLPMMESRNWLLSYATQEGTGRALAGLSRRVSFPNHMDKAMDEVRPDYALYQEEFRNFFPLAWEFSREWVARHTESEGV